MTGKRSPPSPAAQTSCQSRPLHQAQSSRQLQSSPQAQPSRQSHERESDPSARANRDHCNEFRDRIHDEIRDLAALELLFDRPSEAALRKEVASLLPVYRRWIEASPFAVLATSGPNGLDASPRGDPAPLVTVVDEHTLWLPERRGNNRIDSLRNLLHDSRVALLFLVPGTGETLRVNGRARILTTPALLAHLAMNGVAPKCVIEIRIETVYFQCARALQRSRLWQADSRAQVPTAGEILAAVTDSAIDGQAYDRGLLERQRGTLY